MIAGPCKCLPCANRLSDLLAYQQGDACDLPFPDAAFDVVWTQHTAINIFDKATLYQEIFRVLKPGWILAIYDILAGPVCPIHFPVPWASRPEDSHLVTATASRSWRIIKERTLERAALFWLKLWQENNGSYSVHAMRTRYSKKFRYPE